MPTIRGLLLAAAWCAAGPGAFGQPLGELPATPGVIPAPPPEPAERTVPPELEPFEGRPVRVITLRAVAPPPTAEGAEAGTEAPAQAPGTALDATAERLTRNQLRLKEGAPFSSALVSEDISRLNRLGRFRSVESRVRLLADGGVELTYEVSLQPLVADVQSSGNTILSDEELLAATEMLVGTPVDPTQLERASRQIEERYRDKGYYNARVTIEQRSLEQSGIVIFVVREGEKTKVSRVRYEGNLSYTGRELGTAVKTKEAWLLERGPLDNDQLSTDVASLIEYYRNRGHLDVRVDRIVTPSPNGREAIVTFVIDEGPLYTLRSVKLSMAPSDEGVFTAEQLIGLMLVKPGDVYGEGALRKSLDAIKNAYGKMGYADVAVRRREQRDLDEPVVDIILIVTEGRRFRTGTVEIQGNSITRDDVVRRQVTVQPGRPLDTTAATETERRLKASGLFLSTDVKVTLQPEVPEEPGVRDVLVQVGETNTGRFSIGAGVSSDSGVLGTISVTQRNFDITDGPDTIGELFRGDAFRGGGQIFTAQALPGDRVRAFSVGLTDPYLAETDYSGSGLLFYREREYDAYDERRVGGQVSVGRRFGSRWNAQVPFKLESVQLSDIAPDAPTAYFEEQDDALGSVGFSLSRTTLDDAYLPGKGTKIQFELEQFGFAGEDPFTKLQAEYSTFLTVDEDVLGRKTTVQFTGRAGYIPGDADEAPFFERLYLGGQSFRGFDYRAVAPIGIRNDNGEVSNDTVGGNFLFFAGVELKKPLYSDILSGVVFMDTGTVDDEVGFGAYRVSVGVGFRIYVAQLSPAPLAFDFGIPLLKEDTDEKRLFTFSIDVPFN